MENFIFREVDAAPKALIFELSELHDYSQTYVLLILLAREFLAF